MKTCCVIALGLLVGPHTDVLAQTQAAHPAAPVITAAAPAECSKALGDWRMAQLAPAMAALRDAKPDARADEQMRYMAAMNWVATEVTKAAKTCAARFDVDKIPASQLADLVSLYTTAADTGGRRRATERLLSAADLAPRAHGQALLLGMNQAVAASGSYFGIIEGAERMVDSIDALPDSLSDIKLSAHQSMLGRYEYLDVNEGLRKHATALLELGRRLNKPGAVSTAYSSLARSLADRLQPDSALMMLDRADKELGPAATGSRFADLRNRYALIGTKAAPITGEWWINAGESPSPVNPSDGKVRLIEFTAHWCVPCKNSYPGLRSLAERFKGRAFEGVMVTSLYGYIGGRRNLTPEQEVEADRNYYGKEHELPFKVAINRMAERMPPQPDRDYRVGGIPQIAIVDRHGVIRQIVIGWDHGNTQRIGDLVEQLLKN